MSKEPIKSPFVPDASAPTPEQYDYNVLRDNTANEAIKAILKVWADNADSLAYNHDTTTEKIVEALDSVSMKTLEVLTEKKVPNSDMQYVIDSFQALVHQIFSVVTRVKGEWEKELVARVIGERDPGTGKYAKEYSTIEGLVNALNKVRADQGDEGNDYFFKIQKGTDETAILE